MGTAACQIKDVRLLIHKDQPGSVSNRTDSLNQEIACPSTEEASFWPAIGQKAQRLDQPIDSWPVGNLFRKWRNSV